MPGLDPATLEALTRMTVGDALGRVPLPVQVLVAGLMTGCAVWTAVRPTVLRGVAFAACTLMWSRANQALEGPVLLEITADHGLVVADLLPPALLALVVAHRLSARSHPAPSARRPAAAGYPQSHGTLRLRLRPAPLPSPAVPRHPAGSGARRRR